MKKRILLCLLIASVFVITSSSYAWLWTEIISWNDMRFDNVGAAGLIDDDSYSCIVNNGSDEATVRAIIWGNPLPVHFHEVVDPVNDFVYVHTVNQLIDLNGLDAEIQVFNGLFPNSTDYVKVQIGYPF